MLKICRLFLALMVVVVLATTVAIPVLAQDREVTVWVRSTIRHQEYELIIGLFAEKHPDIKVSLQLISGTQDEFMQQLALAIATGTPPDFAWMEGSAVIELAAQGLLLDVTDALEGIRFTPSDLAEMTFNGRLWGAPYYTTSRGLFKRADLFEQVGLNPNLDPANLDELEKWGNKLTVIDHDGTYQRVGFLPWGSNWGVPGWIWAFGGQLFEEANGKVTVTANHPNNLKALQWIQSYGTRFGQQFKPISPIGITGFMNGTLAMDTNSTSSVGRVLEAGIPLTTGRVPHAEGGANGTWGGGQANSIPVNAKNPADAILLLQHFSDPDVQAAQFEAYNTALPANWDALMRVGAMLPSEYGPLLDQLPEARPRTPLWLTYYVQNLRPAEQAVIEGKKTPEQALEDVQTAVAESFAELFGN